tara:strand:- start:141 stop:1100 length:960 start_codon:yes stop_codon:yes gene_type:complete
MSKNIFFESKGPFKLNILFPSNSTSNIKVNDIKTLDEAGKLDLTFFDSLNYKNLAEKTKAGSCITRENLKRYLPNACEAIIVKSVLFELAKVTSKFYPNADIDYPDNSLKKPNKTKFPGVKFGNNVLIGKNVKIGKSSIVGSNTIIEKNVLIGNSCTIGSQIMIKNTMVGNNVVIQDGAKIGLKGFGFIPLKGKNLRFPHVGKVILEDNVEIGASCTIDRGSIGNTIIGKNTFLDNQVHMAHNVKVGENCMIAGQVGFAGSSTLGNNVSIGGQAGISGHLNIGNNVKIGGGSGVVKDIPNDTIVMGYPAVPLKEFLKKN